MEVIYLKSFFNDLKKNKDGKIKQKLKSLIGSIKAADTINEILNVKKMSGYSIAYRIRLGDYRIGVFIENDTVEMVRFVKRNDIYKLFP